MNQAEVVQTIPLTLGEDGTMRVRGSRVTLDSLVDEFKRGASAEQIQEDFPSLDLKDIYCVIAYYLSNKERVEDYLRQQQAEAEETRRFVESRQDTQALRDRLRLKRSR